jgi:hypothetical protein
MVVSCAEFYSEILADMWQGSTIMSESDPWLRIDTGRSYTINKVRSPSPRITRSVSRCPGITILYEMHHSQLKFNEIIGDCTVEIYGIKLHTFI